MHDITITRQEMKDIVQGLKVLRDRTYNRYHLAKDQQSETAQNNLKRYEELEALRVRIEADYGATAGKPLDFMRR